VTYFKELYGIFLEELRETTKKLGQDSWSSGLSLDTRPRVTQRGVFTGCTNLVQETRGLVHTATDILVP
jgi:hypothetical protein